jgi:hypothetical protein
MDLVKHTLANEAKNNNAKCKLRTNIMFIVVKRKPSKMSQLAQGVGPF